MRHATTNDIANWEDHSLSDSIRWHLTIGKHTDAHLKIFEAGFKAGWREAIATLKLHDAKPETGREERKRRDQ